MAGFLALLDLTAFGIIASGLLFFLSKEQPTKSRIKWCIFGFLFPVLTLPIYSIRNKKSFWRFAGVFTGSLVAWFIVTGTLAQISKTYTQNESNGQASVGTSSNEEPTSTPVSTYKIGESFHAGYTQYLVKGIQWKNRIGNEYFGANADGRYLLVGVQVKNADREERMIPPFKLLDENGSEYEESSDKMYLGAEAPLLKSLNPGVQKKLTLLFDVPAEHHYTLQASGGYWSSDKATVKLN